MDDLTHKPPIQLPPEIMDSIASNITLQSDLLSLALSHSTWHDIVIPFHLHYRLVRCTEDDADMWDHLKEAPRRLSNIRSLELRCRLWQNRDWKQLPRLPQQSERMMMLTAELLGRMEKLKTFRWESSGTYGELPPPFQSVKALEEYRNSIGKHYGLSVRTWRRLLWTTCLLEDPVQSVSAIGTMRRTCLPSS